MSFIPSVVGKEASSRRSVMAERGILLSFLKGIILERFGMKLCESAGLHIAFCDILCFAFCVQDQLHLRPHMSNRLTSTAGVI